MMFRSSVLAALVAAVSAKSFIPEGDIPASSAIGRKLMEKAGRGLEQADDRSWMTNYNIKYLSCSSLVQVRAEGEGGGEDGSVLYTQNLVKFALCDASKDCSSCTSGDAQYVVNMNDFIDAYTEMRMNAKEQACEMIRENCYCENANDDEACENACYQENGMSECIQYEGEEEFEIQRYLECAELEGNDGGNNNNGNRNYNYGGNDNGVDMYRQYYVGPTCSEKDGKTINMAVFMDAGCSTKAGSGVFEAFNYGQSLPFESEPVVTLNDCISCIQQDDNQNNNNNNNNNQNNNQNYNGNYNNYNYEVAEICEQSYEQAAKCESNLNTGNSYFYADTSGCTYINSILPKLEKATRKISSNSSSGNGAATVFAVIFFLTTCILGAYAFFLYRKIHRAKVNLSQNDGALA